jgi:hypothetical protein
MLHKITMNETWVDIVVIICCCWKYWKRLLFNMWSLLLQLLVWFIEEKTLTTFVLLLHKYQIGSMLSILPTNLGHWVTTTKCGCNSLIHVQWNKLHCHPTRSHSLGSMNSLKIWWKYLAYKFTFCWNGWNFNPPLSSQGF